LREKNSYNEIHDLQEDVLRLDHGGDHIQNKLIIKPRGKEKYSSANFMEIGMKT